MEIEFALTEALSSAIAEWLEKGEVSISNLPIRFANAIISKELDGDISLLEKYPRNGYKKRDCYVWGASVAKTTLTYFIKLWEIRNEEVHGKPVEQQEKLNSAQMQGK